MNAQQYKNIREHFKLETMMVSQVQENMGQKYESIHDQSVRQTRPGYRVPPNVAAFNNYKKMFSGQPVPDETNYDYVPDMQYDRPLPGSQMLNTEYNQDWEPERPFDPYSEGINHLGGYDPSQMDEYMDNFKR
jgi:hypothetical protein